MIAWIGRSIEKVLADENTLRIVASGLYTVDLHRGVDSPFADTNVFASPVEVVTLKAKLPTASQRQRQ